MVPKRKANRIGLCRDRVIDGAVAIVDREGAAALSMRTLGRELGVEAMSLYSHIASKEELLDLVVERVMTGMRVPGKGVGGAGGGRARAGGVAAAMERVKGVARAFREVGHLHPNVFPMVVMRPRPITAALRPVEAMLDALMDAGFDPARAAQVQRVLLGFVRGYTLWEIGGFATRRRKSPGSAPDKGVIAEIRGLDEGEFRRVTELAERLVVFDPDEEFEAGLELVLRGVRGSAERPAPRKAGKASGGGKDNRQ